MKKITYLIIITGLIFGISSSISGQKAGDEADDFTYNDLDGNELSLSDYKGSVVFLFFFGNTCYLCAAVGDDTETKVQEKFGEFENFQALGLDVWPGSSVAVVSAFKESTGITYPLLLNAADIQSTYDIVHNRVMVIDTEGVIRHKGTTAVTNDLDDAIAVIEEYLTLASDEDLVSQAGNSLAQNYPNPVSGNTTIEYTLEKPGNVSLKLYNTIGGEVLRMVEEHKLAGPHDQQLNLEGLAPGIYFYQLNVNDYSAVKKLIVK